MEKTKMNVKWRILEQSGQLKLSAEIWKGSLSLDLSGPLLVVALIDIRPRSQLDSACLRNAKLAWSKRLLDISSVNVLQLQSR